MLISADQLLCHAVGDYLLQSDWMALNKTKRWAPAIIHAMTYAIPFLLLRPSLLALAVIVGTHAIIDRLTRWLTSGAFVLLALMLRMIQYLDALMHQ